MKTKNYRLWLVSVIGLIGILFFFTFRGRLAGGDGATPGTGSTSPDPTAENELNRRGSASRAKEFTEIGQRAERRSGAGFVKLTIRNGASGAPVSGVRVVACRQDSSDVVSIVTGPEGEAALPFAGTYHIAVEAPGHVPCDQFINIPKEGAVLELLPSGKCIIQLSDELGRPVPGVELLLLPPLRDGLEWSDRTALEASAPDFWDPVARRVNCYLQLLKQGIACGESNLKPAILSIRPGGSPWSQLAGDFPASTAPILFKNVSDGNGYVEWSDLPVNDHYRWGIVSKVDADPEPPFELTTYTPTADGFSRRDGVPERISGAFSVKSGETTFLKARVHFASGITGKFINSENGGTAAVEFTIEKRTTVLHPDLPGRFLSIAEKPWSGVSRADGRFEVSGLRAGSLELRAKWCENGSDFYFINSFFELGPGETKDLGLLQSMKGEIVTVEVPLIGGDGRAMKPDEVFEPGAPRDITFLLFERGAPAADSGSMVSTLSTGIGNTIRLHGLRPSDWSLQIFGILQKSVSAGLPGLKPGLALRRMSEGAKEFKTPAAGMITFPVVIDRVSEFVIQSVIPSRQKGSEIHYYFVHQDTKQVYSADGQARVAESPGAGRSAVVECRIKIPPGRYKILATSSTTASHPETAGIFTETEVNLINPQEVVRLEPGEGSIVRGRATRRGKPFANRPISAFPADFPKDSGIPFVYTSVTDEKGEFVIRGVGPGKNMIFQMFPQMVLAAGPGEVTTVELVAR